MGTGQVSPPEVSPVGAATSWPVQGGQQRRPGPSPVLRGGGQPSRPTQGQVGPTRAGTPAGARLTSRLRELSRRRAGRPEHRLQDTGVVTLCGRKGTEVVL